METLENFTLEPQNFRISHSALCDGVCESPRASAELSPSPSPFLRHIWKDARILVVDDEPANVLLLQVILTQAGYTHIQTLTDSREVAALAEQSPPDLVLLDLMMPFKDGFGVMSELQNLDNGRGVPILILTADTNPLVRHRALSGGARDFVTKPVDQAEVLARVHNLLETQRLQLQLRAQNCDLEARVRQRTHELEEINARLRVTNERLTESQTALQASQIEILHRLALAAEYRDDDTGQHTQRVGELASRVARQIGWDEARCARLRTVAPLHDVGKIGVPDAILLKPGRLSPEEFEVIKTHTVIGAGLLAHSQCALVSLARLIALSHHERWDGTGYPHGLCGEEIPLEGRILSVVDVFDALTSERPYKKAWPREKALAEIETQAGKQFDPQIVRAFLEVIHAPETPLPDENEHVFITHDRPEWR